MKTKLHHYAFNTALSGQKELYAALVAQIKADAPQARGHRMHSLSDRYNSAKAGTTEQVEIETAHLFDNQWNTTDARVFDWFEEVVYRNGREQKHIRRGHWLEITPEMAQVRTECRKCGYCGKQYGPLHEMPVPADGFCRACLDSPYLKETDLHLLRLRSLVEKADYSPLSAEEATLLMPLYVSRQTTGNDSRAKAARDKQRADVVAKFETKTADALTERDGMLWLWDRGISLDNVIFYSHTGKFGFGWRSPVSESVKSALLDVLAEFPFPYEIKSETGTLMAA